MPEGGREASAWERLTSIVRRLRAPGGCPWDRAQTHGSLRPYALEEAREVVLAVDSGDPGELREELGDLLLQVLLHAVLAEEAGAFSLADVLDGLAAKLVRRHPHVFGDAPQPGTPAEAARQWEARKAAEGTGTPPSPGGAGGWLASVPRGAQALAEARALGERAAEVGFDWPGPEEVAVKLGEEHAEFTAAWRSWSASGATGPETPEARAHRLHAEEEFGDLLFAAVQTGRLLGMDAEVALLAANAKFRRRFAGVEALLAAQEQSLHGHSQSELDRFWERVKAEEARPHGRPG